MPVIRVENLCKTFRSGRKNEVKALDHVHFTIDKGEFVGFIGPNGAGKSTTIKILTGILVPDSGICEVLDLVPWKNRIRNAKQFGVVFGQKTQLWWDLPLLDSFKILKELYSIPVSQYKSQLGTLIRILHLENLLDRPVRQLSLGERMKSDLAASLLHQPSILFLDEPTIGLDIPTKLAMRQFLKEINREFQTTILLATHDMNDIEELCPRILFIHHGIILKDSTLQQVRKELLDEKRISFEIDPSSPFQPIPGTTLISRTENRIELSFHPEEITIPDLIGKITHQVSVDNLVIESPSIEEIVMKLYQSAV
jgi:ABC-2 type transport system ATP-binding protein